VDDHQERQLAQGLREGRIEAWHALYEAYAGPVWQYVARLMGPGAADVADVVQETFLAAARSARTYHPERAHLWPWMVGIARNQVALCYRKRQHQERIKRAVRWLATTGQTVICWLEHRQQTPPEAMAAAELATLVRAALSELPADYQGILTARYLDGAGVEEIAAQDNTTATAVRSKLARARRAFRETFSKSVFVEEAME
jgi:RNA polymerase sigma-70 factor (ECF subfamily)